MWLGVDIRGALGDLVSADIVAWALLSFLQRFYKEVMTCGRSVVQPMCPHMLVIMVIWAPKVFRRLLRLQCCYMTLPVVCDLHVPLSSVWQNNIYQIIMTLTWHDLYVVRYIFDLDCTVFMWGASVVKLLWLLTSNYWSLIAVCSINNIYVTLTSLFQFNLDSEMERMEIENLGKSVMSVRWDLVP